MSLPVPATPKIWLKNKGQGHKEVNENVPRDENGTMKMYTDARRETYTVSQKTSHLWFAITLTHMNRF